MGFLFLNKTPYIYNKNNEKILFRPKIFKNGKWVDYETYICQGFDSTAIAGYAISGITIVGVE